ncbi:MAG: hypothetical protein M1832_001297 [Thelocarpon impressellum]|nr:MAG: hypothetical protein M1832_001297 [Thelocarpon impressellum]
MYAIFLHLPALSSSASTARASSRRSLATFSRPSVLGSVRPSLAIAQRRYASDEVDPSEPKPDETAASTESLAHTRTGFEESSTPSSADVDDHSTIASAIGSVASGVSSTSSSVAESVAETVEHARDSVTEGAAAAAAAVGMSERGRTPGRVRGPFPPSTNVFIGNLFFSVTEEDLKQLLSRVGNVRRASIVYDQRGLSKGIGFATFESLEESKRAVEEMHGQTFEGRTLAVQYARTRERPQNPTPQNPPSDTLFIGNLSFDLTDQQLRALFRPIPGVVNVNVYVDKRTGQMRGFAHVQFSDTESAEKALTTLKGTELLGRPLRVDFGAGKPNRRQDYSSENGESRSGDDSSF